MAEQFLTRVSFAGVPHTLEHIGNLSQATLTQLSPATVCQIYWMLSKITVSYSYVINGIDVSRSISIESSVVPKNRMISPASFYKSEYDSSLQTSYVVQLDLSKVYFDPSDSSILGINFNIQESDNFGLFVFGLHQISGMSSVSSNASIFGRNLTIYLNYNPSLVTSASITNVSFATEFFII